MLWIFDLISTPNIYGVFFIFLLLKIKQKDIERIHHVPPRIEFQILPNIYAFPMRIFKNHTIMQSGSILLRSSMFFFCNSSSILPILFQNVLHKCLPFVHTLDWVSFSTFIEIIRNVLVFLFDIFSKIFSCHFRLSTFT